MVNILHHKICVNDGFGVSKVGTSTHGKKKDKEDKNPKKFKDMELQVLLDEDDSETQKQSNWALVNKLFAIGYERWERFRRPVDGY